jgi:hypothetical protein
VVLFLVLVQEWAEGWVMVLFLPLALFWEFPTHIPLFWWAAAGVLIWLGVSLCGRPVLSVERVARRFGVGVGVRLWSVGWWVLIALFLSYGGVLDNRSARQEPPLPE